MNISFDNRFVRELPADPDTSNTRRQVYGSCYSLVDPIKTADPKLVSFSKEAADLLNLNESDCGEETFLRAFSGNKILAGMQPHAM